MVKVMHFTKYESASGRQFDTLAEAQLDELRVTTQAVIDSFLAMNDVCTVDNVSDVLTMNRDIVEQMARGFSALADAMAAGS